MSEPRPETTIDFRLLFEESPDVLLVLLPDAPRYTIVTATRSRYQATHTTPEQSVGRGLFELFPDNPDDPGASGMRNLRASLERVLATRKPDTMAVQKYDIRGPDGSFQPRYWSPKNIPILSPDGSLRYILHRVEDVTELVRASELGEELRGRSAEMEREVIRRSRELAAANAGLREANAKLGELDAAKTAFFSNISHEFRTPLTLMLGPLEDGLGDTVEPPGPRQRARLELAHGNALRLLKLVNALLDFSRLEAGRMQASFAPVDLARFTAELAGMFQSAAHKAGIRLVIDCPPLSEPAWVDRSLWEKIVPNLLSNALKFTHAGEIAVRLREESARFVLEVADTGIGIPEEQIPHLFERFYRVPGAKGRTHEGSGIGLSLAKELVVLHGGSISLESAVGRGTTFRVLLPKGSAHLPPEAVSRRPADPGASRDLAAYAAEARTLAPEPATAPAPRPDEAERRPRERVLVVDDNADLRAYLSGLLSADYDVTTAGDGQAALDALRSRPHDIVLSDVMMPRLDGVGLVRRLREDPRSATVPIILLSARAGEESSAEGLASGADDYLFKPFSAKELLVRVRTHLALARARRSWIQELERANRELDAFSYSVSHDLRSPLRAISGYADMLLERSSGVLDAESLRCLDVVQAGCRRMGEMIDDLLRLSGVTRCDLSRTALDLGALAREVVEGLRRADPGRSVEFRVAGDLQADADPRLVRSALENLLGNAWKFTRKTPRPVIEVGATRADGRTAYFVRDNGAGFDASLAGKLFLPFSRLHAEKDFEGTGIGLATVQRIIHRHGGRLWADGRPGQGATFYFTLVPAVGEAPR